MMAFIESNPIFGNAKKVLIPNGVDTKVFRPSEAAPWGNPGGAPARRVVLGLVASRLSEPRKGAHLMPHILRGLREGLAGREAELILVGSDPGTEFMRSVAPFCECRHVGEVSEEGKLAEIYSTFDVTVVPSLIDNFPSVVLESLACGTPVAAFRVGGLPDMIEPGRTGFLAEPGDAFGLGYSIGMTAAVPGRIDAMRHECRKIAVDRYDLRIQAERYIALYRSLAGAPTR
jgi:glycosyltransferase involved in cell wall biosynthesis